MREAESSTLGRILAAAQQEFLQDGFQGASLRRIARQAGVTTGALYGYFKSKEELFDALVQAPYAELMRLYRSALEEFEAMEPQRQHDCMDEYSLNHMLRMTEHVYAHFEAFKLILCCSKGTAYENLLHQLSQLDCDATHRFSSVMDRCGTPTNVVHPQLEHMLTSGMFCAYFELVIHDIPRESAEQYIRQLVCFYAAGWQRLLGL